MYNLISYKVSDKGDYYLVVFNTPHIKKEELDLRVINGRLTLKIEGRNEAQQIKVNSNVMKDAAGDILARYDDETLTVTVPKRNFKERIIEIF